MKDEWYLDGCYLICFNCKTKFIGSNDGSVSKENILCDKCFNEKHGIIE